LRTFFIVNLDSDALVWERFPLCLGGYFGVPERLDWSTTHPNGRRAPHITQRILDGIRDLLVLHNALVEIDYLSIDTKGSELTILRALDFHHWRFNVISVEHNWVQSARDEIHALLTSQGYTRVLTEFSHRDDWYIRNGLQTYWDIRFSALRAGRVPFWHWPNALKQTAV
jgi:hypothetical protein